MTGRHERPGPLVPPMPEPRQDARERLTTDFLTEIAAADRKLYAHMTEAVANHYADVSRARRALLAGLQALNPAPPGTVQPGPLAAAATQRYSDDVTGWKPGLDRRVQP